jgi:plasmid stabilization system protein ParE
MAVYELSEAADGDLQAIARYTAETWGVEPARHYGELVENHFQAIGCHKARTRGFLKHRPELRVSRVEHHFVFHLVRENQSPLILAVLHEKMDLMSRLRNRLGG